MKKNEVTKQKSKYRTLGIRKVECLLWAKPAPAEQVPHVADEHRNAIKSFWPSQYVAILNTLALGIFTKEDLAPRSIPGKNCAKMGENQRLWLDQDKIPLLNFSARCAPI